MTSRNYRYYSCNIEAPYLKCRDISVNESTLVDDLTDLQDKTQNLSADPSITTVSGSLLVDTTNVGTTLTSLGSRVTTNETNITSLTSRVTTNETNITSLTSRVTTNETNITSLTSRTTENETDISSLETRMTTAESDVGSLETRMTTAESDISSLETRMTTAETDISAVEGDVTALESKTVYMTAPSTNVTRFENNVGINKSDPGSSLDVSGQVRATSFYTNYQLGSIFSSTLSSNQSFSTDSKFVFPAIKLSLNAGTYILTSRINLAVNSGTASVAEVILGFTSNDTSFMSHSNGGSCWAKYHAGNEPITATVLTDEYYQQPTFEYTTIISFTGSGDIRGMGQIKITAGSPFLKMTETLVRSIKIS